MNLVDWFNKGMTSEEYINSMEKHKENLQAILQKFEIPAGDEASLANLKDEKLRVIVITEDWCGDAMLNVPILLKLAEKTGLEVRMLLRDQNLELMDQYLTNGTSRAIPISFLSTKMAMNVPFGDQGQKGNNDMLKNNVPSFLIRKMKALLKNKVKCIVK